MTQYPNADGYEESKGEEENKRAEVQARDLESQDAQLLRRRHENQRLRRPRSTPLTTGDAEVVKQLIENNYTTNYQT